MNVNDKNHQLDLRRAFAAGAKFLIDNIVCVSDAVTVPDKRRIDDAARQWVTGITGR